MYVESQSHFVNLVDKADDFVGREQELSALLTLWKQSKNGAGLVVTVDAISGMGKSRLLSQFVQKLEHENITLCSGQAVALNATRPFALLHMLAERLASVAKQDPNFKERLLNRLDLAHQQALKVVFPELQNVFGNIDNTDLPMEELYGVAKTIRALAALLDLLGSAQKPFVFILDDCQWADELTLNMLTYWNKSAESKKSYCLVCCAFRSDEVPANHPLRNFTGGHTIQLSGLDQKCLFSLVNSITPELPQTAKDFVVLAAKGNPFLACSAARGLIEAGIMETASDASNSNLLEESLDSLKFLQRRFKYLNLENLKFLEWAAVAGKTFNARLYNKSKLSETQDILKDLISKRFINQIDNNNYIFVHDKIREALIMQITESDLKIIHKQIAEDLEQSHRDRIYEIAYHLDAAGEFKKALNYALQAAQQSRSCYSLDTAKEQYLITLRGVENSKDLELIVYEGLGDVLMLAGNYLEAETYLTRAKTLVEDKLGLARIQRKLGELFFKMGRNIEAAKALESAITYLGEKVPKNMMGFAFKALLAIIRQSAHTTFPKRFLFSKGRLPNETERLVAQIYNRLAILYWFSGGAVKTFWSHLSALNFIEKFEISEELIHNYACHAPGMSLVGWGSRGREYGRRALEMLRQVPNNRLIEGQTLHFNGVAHYCTSHYRSSMDLCLSAVRTLEDVGDF